MTNRWKKGRPHRNHSESKENKRESGQYLNVLKKKVMATGDIGEVRVDGKLV